MAAHRLAMSYCGEILCIAFVSDGNSSVLCRTSVVSPYLCNTVTPWVVWYVCDVQLIWVSCSGTLRLHAADLVYYFKR